MYTRIHTRPCVCPVCKCESVACVHRSPCAAATARTCVRPCNHARGMELCRREASRAQRCTFTQTQTRTDKQPQTRERRRACRRNNVHDDPREVAEVPRETLRSFFPIAAARSYGDLTFLVDRNHERHSRARTGRNGLELIRVK